MSKKAVRNVFGCGFVFLTYDFLLVGGAAAWLLSDKGEEEYIAIGAACVVGAGAAYAARVGFEDGRWERLYIGMLTALLAGAFALFGIANQEDITLPQVTLGLGGTLLAASILAVPITIIHLLIKNRRDRNVVTGASPSSCSGPVIGEVDQHLAVSGEDSAVAGVAKPPSVWRGRRRRRFVQQGCGGRLFRRSSQPNDRGGGQQLDECSGQHRGTGFAGGPVPDGPLLRQDGSYIGVPRHDYGGWHSVVLHRYPAWRCPAAGGAGGFGIARVHPQGEVAVLVSDLVEAGVECAVWDRWGALGHVDNHKRAAAGVASGSASTVVHWVGRSNCLRRVCGVSG